MSTNDKDSLIEQIDAILPQTQCGQCGYSGCLPYATAIAEGTADINQCPPGDEVGIQQLAAILGVPVKPLNTQYGVPKPKAVALIDEEFCIGCTFCIQACPVDAIVGAAKLMHTVLSEECTGCELCLAPCPVDCIRMIPVAPTEIDEEPGLKRLAADKARARYQNRLRRLGPDWQKKADKLKKKASSDRIAIASVDENRKKATILAAMERAKALVEGKFNKHQSESEG